MSDAPERIWAATDGIQEFSDAPEDGWQMYIRSDLYEAQAQEIERLQEALQFYAQNIFDWEGRKVVNQAVFDDAGETARAALEANRE